MSELTQLIDRLYQEGVVEGQLPDATPGSAPHPIDDSGQPDVQRLYDVLAQMGAMLHHEDLPEIHDAVPTDEVCLRILNHWAALQQSVCGLRQHIESLDADISRMQPWGDFDVMKVEQLASRGCHVRFWSIEADALTRRLNEPWIGQQTVLIVAQSADVAYFVTVTQGADGVQIPPEAQPVEICPSPVSTLIMLQTRDKDSLRRHETLLGDYALAHYGEVYAALRARLPQGTAMPQLQPEHPHLAQRIVALFKRGQHPDPR